MTQIYSEPAYYAAVKANIIANALKTFSKTNQDIVDFLYGESASNLPFLRSLHDALFRDYGKLTDRQCEAVRNFIAKSAERKAATASKKAAEKANSEWVGAVGERAVLQLTVRHIVDLDGFYGWSGLFICTDQVGNKIIYKGTTGIGNVGGTVTVRATIKKHGEREGEKQTEINRPVIISRIDKE